MAKMNVPDKRKTARTTNPEGAPAYKLPVKERFVGGLLTCFWNEPKFYGDTTPDLLTAAFELVDQDPGFVARAAAYARNVMSLRTAPTAMLGVLANSKEGKHYLKWAGQEVIKRADQITEALAFLLSMNRKLVNMRTVQGMLSDAFNRFDDYQFAKYDGRSNAVSMKDAIRMIHPKPKDEAMSALFDKIMKGELKAPETWEVKMRTAKEDGRSKADTWDDLIRSRKIGYMALLRNLRNIKESGATELPAALTRIADPDQVAKSKQFPYRFYSAYRELQKVAGSGDILSAVGTALGHSAMNCPVFEGVTMTAADNSGSMDMHLSQKSIATNADLANVFQSMIVRRNPGTITSVFGAHFAVVTVDPMNNPATNADIFKGQDVGHATNGHKAVEYLIRNGVKVDRIIMLTDGVLWDTGDRDFECQIQHGSHGYTGQKDPALKTAMDQYRRQVNPDVWLHIVDLAGYGTTPIWIDYKQKVNFIAGFGDAVFTFIPKVEAGLEPIVDEINGYGNGAKT